MAEPNESVHTRNKESIKKKVKKCQVKYKFYKKKEKGKRVLKCKYSFCKSGISASLVKSLAYTHAPPPRGPDRQRQCVHGVDRRLVITGAGQVRRAGAQSLVQLHTHKHTSATGETSQMGKKNNKKKSCPGSKVTWMCRPMLSVFPKRPGFILEGCGQELKVKSLAKKKGESAP